MATAAELGLTTPAGSDYISEGDDAITNNAQRLATLYTDLDNRANLPVRVTVNDEDLNSALEPQLIRHTIATGVQNLPPWDASYSSAAITFVQVLNVRQGTTSYAAQVAYRYGPVPEMAWRAARSTTGNWQPWQIVRARDTELDDAPARRADVLSRARARRGGGIGTAGLPAVALRFDHHTGPWAEKVLPLLEARGLPWAQAINPYKMGSGDDTMTYADLQSAAIRSGGEVWNHGGNHGDALYGDEAVREIPAALRALEAGLPRLAIEGWAPPGLAAGGYMGAAPFSTLDQNSSTYTGQLIQRNHAFIAGYAEGVYRTLDPTIQPIGAPHITIDQATPAQIGRALDALGEDGVALMLHPNYLDQTGYMSTAELTAVLDDIVARRAAGTLRVLTYSGLWLADASSDSRNDLLIGQAAETTGTWSGTWNPYRRENRLGSAREVSALIRSATASSVEVRVTAGAALLTTRTLSVPASTDWQAVSVPVTLPTDLTDSVTVTITTAAGVTQRAQALAAI